MSSYYVRFLRGARCEVRFLVGVVVGGRGWACGMAVLLCFALFCFALLYCFALLSYSAFWSFFLNRRLLPPLPFPPSPRWTYPSIYPSVYLSIRPSTHLSNCLSVYLSIRRSSSPHSFARALPLPLSDILADGMAWRMDKAAELIRTYPSTCIPLCLPA